MKKLKLTLTLILFLSNIFCEDNIYDDLLEKLFKTNENFSIMQVHTKMENRNILNEKLRWLPKFKIENDASYIGFIHDRNSTAYSINSKLILDQKLLLGSNLRIFAGNNIKMLKDNKYKFQYNFSAGTVLNIPLYVFTPLLFTSVASLDFYSTNNKTHAKTIENTIKTNKIISEVVLYLGEYFLQSEILELDLKKLYISEILNNANNIFWQDGKISTLDLNEKILENEKLKSQHINNKLKLQIIKNKLTNIGLTEYDVPKNFTSWLEEWECLLSKLKVENLNEFDLQALHLDFAWNSTVANTMDIVPNFFIACNFESVDNSINKYKPKFTQAIKETFEKGCEFRWSVSLGLNLNFDPFSEKNQINQNIKDLKEIYKIQKTILDKNHKEELLNVKNNIYSLQEIIKLKSDAIKIIEMQFEKANILKINGKLSDADLQMQELYLKESKIELLRARLNYIIYMITFYK